MEDKQYYCTKCKIYTKNVLMKSILKCKCGENHVYKLCVNCYYSTHYKQLIHPYCPNISTEFYHSNVVELHSNIKKIYPESIDQILQKSDPINIVYPSGRQSYYDVIL